MIPPRTRLANRRRSTTCTITPPTGGPPLHTTIGFDAHGAARELFLRAVKPASDLDLIADDAGVLVSLLLQAGYTAASLVGRLGQLDDGSPSSFIGAALALAVKLEATGDTPPLDPRPAA